MLFSLSETITKFYSDHNDHFYSEVHNRFLGNVFTSVIEKTDGFQLKKREN